MPTHSADEAISSGMTGPDAGTAGQEGQSRWGSLVAALAAHKVLTGIGAFFALSIIVYAADPHAANSGNHTPPAE